MLSASRFYVLYFNGRVGEKMLKCCLGHHPKSSVTNSGKYLRYKTLLWCISGDGPDEGGSCRWVFIYLVLCFRQVPHIIALMHSQSVITTHIFIPSSGIPMHPCLCSRSINSPHFLQLPVSAPLKGLQQPLVTHNWNRVPAFNSSWLVFSDFVFFFSLCQSASGRPPCVRHCDGHGDGALRPSWSRLRH